MKPLRISAITILIILTQLVFLTSCDNKEKQAENNPEVFKYIAAYTGGTISKQSRIVVQFVDQAVDYSEVNKPLKNIPISFYPEIKGKAIWTNIRTLEFIPEKMLTSSTSFIGKVNLAQIIPEIHDSLKSFEFEFKSIIQSLNVQFDGIQNVNPEKLDRQKLSGNITTADFETTENIEQMFVANLDNKEVKTTWTHTDNGISHSFVIDSINRTNDQQELFIEWDGRNFGIDINGNESFNILALGDFKLLEVIGHNGVNQHVAFHFSDPLDKQQDLDGVIRVSDYDLSYIIDGNVIKAFPNVRLIGNISATVEPGVKNIAGHKIQQRVNDTITFEEIKPQVKLKGKGTIIPGTAKLPFIFETANLSAIDVRVIQIHEKNVPQFLQVNDLSGSNQLKRVGHIIAMKKIDLGKGNSLDLKSWNLHSLDLSTIIKAKPGAIYEVSIGFRKSYSLYTCSDSTSSGDSPNMLAVDEDWAKPDKAQAEDSYWDYYEEEESFDWDDRHNPCKTAYYTSNKSVSRNVLASTIGLTSKMGDNGDFFVAATDINTAAPIPGLTLEIYNYQQHMIKKLTTDQNGIASLNFKQTPYLMIAKKGKERGYLKLDDGSSLSMSMFDVSGKNYKQGVKGFIYAERGVWRPGDSIFVNLILEDKLRAIPNDYPVIFNLYNPKGQLVSKVINKNSLNGFYTFHTKTEAEAPTGNYLAKIKAGGITFSKTIKVETIVPNRLKLTLDFDFKHLSKKTINETSELSVKWLHGAIAKNLDAEVKVTLTPFKTKFKRFTDYVFDDASKSFAAEEKTLFKGALNENGKAQIPANITANESAPGMLMANFKGVAYEPGGNFSVDRFSIPYSPYSAYVGIKTPKGDKARRMLLTDTNHVIKIATLDPSGELISDRKVELSLYKLEWKWWWDKSAQNVNYNARYFSNPLTTGTVVSKNGRATWPLRINYPEWGRYLLRACDEAGHCSSKIIYMDWPGWAGRGEKEKGSGSNMLSFTSNKKKYQVGENITLNIPTGSKGRALLTIEDGDKVIDSYWINTNKGTTQFSFTATSKMAPNVYASISLIQSHAQTKNDRPIRMYGVIPLMVEDAKTILNPVIQMPKTLKPESKVDIRISEKNNKAMTYTLAVVDEGLLDLTRFKTPNPWSYFYQRKSLNVKTWDLFNEVLGAQSDRINSLLSIGGDGEGSTVEEGGKQNRFKPVVKFIGPFELKAGQTKNHTITIPNYIGSVKTMVVAGNNGVYGSTYKTTPVKKPLMALASLPRVLSPGENITLPVTIFALEKNIKNVKIKVEGHHLIDVVGSKTQQLKFSQEGDKLINFRLKVKESIGTGSIKVIATSGNEKAIYYVDINVRAPNPPVSDVTKAEVAAGKTWNNSYKVVGMEGTNTTTLELSSIPPLNLEKRLKYLISYPHGCVEQTTSSVFPQLYLNDLLSLSSDKKLKIDKNIKAGINRLRKFQCGDGGMSYWPGNATSNEWGTNYAGNFLLESQLAGYNVPKELINNWKKYQKKKAKSWTDGTESSQLTQAYRLYLLALSENAELGAMNRMRLKKSLTPLSKWYLAAAYKLASRPEIARNLIQKLPKTIGEAKDHAYTYGSHLRNEAILLQTLSIIGERNDASEMAIKISKKLDTKHWHSTQTTAYCLVAMAKYIGKSGISKTMNFSYKIGDGEWIQASSNKPIWQHSFKDTRGSKTVSIRNADGLLHAKVIATGIPAIGNESDASNGLKISNTYYDLEGNEIDINQLDQGSNIISEITIENVHPTADYSDMALTYMLPSGWEIHNTRLDGSALAMDKPTYQDFRDDRVNFYYNIKHKQKLTFKVALNATYLGKYYLPAIYSEAMYDNSINGRIGGRWIEVIKDKDEE